MFRRILKPGRNCQLIEKIDSSGLLIDGRDYYRAFYHAASRAKNYILISGWQFDRTVALLRGDDQKEAHGDVRFLNFLTELCAKTPGVRTYILAWDFSMLFMLEREWMQELMFNWTSCDRLSFHFDNRHALGASQHQKFIVIDGQIAFAGGMDVCSGRWDDREHLAVNPERMDPDGKTYEPYHDIQAYFIGNVAERLTELFRERWLNCTGSELTLPPPERDGRVYLPEEEIGIPVFARKTAISRTQGQTLAKLQMPIKEIRYLYVDAIMSAKELIYIENQYLSSFAVFNALMERMSAKDRPKLDIIFILPHRPHGILEEIFVGMTQSRLLKKLRKTAFINGHSLGVYYSAATGADGKDVPVYVHSKLLIVDDRFMTVGSANTTNRSFGLDTELNLSWEARYLKHTKTIRSIKKARVELLKEFTGITDPLEVKKLEEARGIVDYLNLLADHPPYKLRKHLLEHAFTGSELIKSLKLDNILVDPDKAVIEENIFEMFSNNVISAFYDGYEFVKKWLFEAKKKAG